MKHLLIALFFAASAFALDLQDDRDGTGVYQRENGVKVYYRQVVTTVTSANPAYTRYWWLYAIAQKYGKTLPCDVADLRLAMYAATTPENSSGIALDAVDAATCFFANGGNATDWSVVPAETITVTETRWEKVQ
jgi:hypothetical protein